jgi:hypothetical protein
VAIIWVSQIGCGGTYQRPRRQRSVRVRSQRGVRPSRGASESEHHCAGKLCAWGGRDGPGRSGTAQAGPSPVAPVTARPGQSCAQRPGLASSPDLRICSESARGDTAFSGHVFQPNGGPARPGRKKAGGPAPSIGPATVLQPRLLQEVTLHSAAMCPGERTSNFEWDVLRQPGLVSSPDLCP